LPSGSGPSLRAKYHFPSRSAFTDATKAAAFAFSSVEVLDRDNTEKPSESDLIAPDSVNRQDTRDQSYTNWRKKTMPRIDRSKSASEPAEDLERPSIRLEPVFTVNEIAGRLKISDDLTRDMFVNEVGVIFVGSPKGRAGKRRKYRSMRIPESVLARVVRRISQSA
jgi:hypothetical protein